jgi:probable HAF family extracellular repeat protein
MLRKITLTVLAVLALASAAFAPTSAETLSIPGYGYRYIPRYTPRDLGTLGGNFTYASAMNGNQQIVGQSQNAQGQYHAFLWNGGLMSDLGTLGGTYSAAFAINNFHNSWDARCQAAGYAQTSRGEFHAFRWDTLYGMIDLGTLGGTYSPASGLNYWGYVVGGATTSSGAYHAFLWDPTVRRMTDLGTLGGSWSAASSVDDYRTVGGVSATANNQIHGFLWTPQQGMRDLGLLNPATVYPMVGTINFGSIQYGFWVQNLNITTLTGTVIYLTPLSGDTYSSTNSMNGFAVGSSCSAAGIERAAMWVAEANYGMDLNSRIPTNTGWILNRAVTIAYNGSYIAVNGTHYGQTRACLLTSY